MTGYHSSWGLNWLSINRIYVLFVARSLVRFLFVVLIIVILWINIVINKTHMSILKLLLGVTWFSSWLRILRKLLFLIALGKLEILVYTELIGSLRITVLAMSSFLGVTYLSWLSRSNSKDCSTSSTILLIASIQMTLNPSHAVWSCI